MSRLAGVLGKVHRAGALRAILQPTPARTWLHLRGGLRARRIAMPAGYADALLREMTGSGVAPPAPGQSREVPVETPAGTAHVEVAVAATAFGPAVTVHQGRWPLRTGLDHLGMDAAQREGLRQALEGDGAILVHGATMSGRSSVLYSLMHELARAGRVVWSAEHWIHRRLEGVQQVRVDWDRAAGPSGWTAEDVAREARRAEVDALMLAEVPSWSYAARHAGVLLAEGGLVLANTRGRDLGTALGYAAAAFGEANMVGRPVTLVGPERHRAACRSCCERRPVDPEVLARLGLDRAVLAALREETPSLPEDPRELRVARPRGCAACFHEGRRGGLSVYQVHRIRCFDPVRGQAQIVAEAVGPDRRHQLLRALARGALLFEDALLALGL